MPLVFDMPLEDLKKYRGRNPKPKDFDSFWNKALGEMQAVDTDVTLEKADFRIPFGECFHLYFNGVRGARIHVKYIRPKNIESLKPAVLFFHGYAGSSGDWFSKYPYAAAGFHVFAMDCRGQGGLSEDTGGVKGSTLNGHITRGLEGGPEDLLFRNIFLDTAQLVRIAAKMDGVDKNRLAVTGGSQGGGLSIACGALSPQIKKVATRFPFLSDYKRVWEMDLQKEGYLELSDYFRRFDPLHEKENDVFLKLGYIDVQHLANRIRGEVLMGVGLMDDICPPSSQFAAFNKIVSPKKLKIYPDFGHEDLPDMDDSVFLFLLDLL